MIDSDDDEAPLLRGFRPPSVLGGPTHESHSDTLTRQGEVNVEVAVEEGPRLAPQEEFSQVENFQPVRLGRRLVLVPQSTGTPRSVQDRSEFSMGSIFELFLLMVQGTVTLTPPIVRHVRQQVLRIERNSVRIIATSPHTACGLLAR